jgi:hypothetical protein
MLMLVSFHPHKAGTGMYVEKQDDKSHDIRFWDVKSRERTTGQQVRNPTLFCAMGKDTPAFAYVQPSSGLSLLTEDIYRASKN